MPVWKAVWQRRIGMGQELGPTEKRRGTPRLYAELRLSKIAETSQSKISTADAITVVQRPRLSPTADCVTLAVRTILFEMR